MKRKYKWTVRSDKLPKPIVLATRDEFKAWLAKHPELRNKLWVTRHDKKAKAEITWRF